MRTVEEEEKKNEKKRANRRRRRSRAGVSSGFVAFFVPDREVSPKGERKGLGSGVTCCWCFKGIMDVGIELFSGIVMWSENCKIDLVSYASQA